MDNCGSSDYKIIFATFRILEIVEGLGSRGRMRLREGCAKVVNQTFDESVLMSLMDSALLISFLQTNEMYKSGCIS